jgi:adenylate cyclase class 2
MSWEVEQKYRVADTEQLEQNISQLGGSYQHSETQVDTYFRHPCRDFKKTDEAFRFRTINGRTFVTYKGPRLDGPVKTRPEVEIPLHHETEQQWKSICLALGFTTAADVRKVRRVFSLPWHHVSVTVAIDEVESLGSFAEVELVIEHETELQKAHELIQSLAAALVLQQVEKRSYLGLVLDQQSS